MYVPKACNETHQQKLALSRMDESCLLKENRKEKTPLARSPTIAYGIVSSVVETLRDILFGIS
jgi:hypothetical protein